MLRSTVQAQATLSPLTICGKDERVRVDPETSPPYNWICSLLITDKNGTQWVGSGFKIHIPNVNCCIVVTSGHCVYDFDKGVYLETIRVKFPGQEAVTVRPVDMYASPEYIANKSEDHDYGIIILPGNSDEGFGWSAIIPDSELSGCIVTNCGYPGDKHPWPQMWITGGEVTRVTVNKLYYMNDTAGGQSGSPVYTWYKGYWTVVGVHSHGTCPNSAPRFTGEMIYRFLERTQNLKKYALRLAQFPNVYIRCDGRDVKKPASRGSGTINCQYGPPSSWETFYIYPVEVTPSLALEQTYIVVLQNCKFPESFVRLDGRTKTTALYDGSSDQYVTTTTYGMVNCQWKGNPAPSTWESFFFEKDTNKHAGEVPCYSFRSVEFPNHYIHADGSRVTSYKKKGGGKVKCQHYDTGKGPTVWEHFYLEPARLAAKL